MDLSLGYNQNCNHYKAEKGKKEEKFNLHITTTFVAVTKWFLINNKTIREQHFLNFFSSNTGIRSLHLSEPFNSRIWRPRPLHYWALHIFLIYLQSVQFPNSNKWVQKFWHVTFTNNSFNYRTKLVNWKDFLTSTCIFVNVTLPNIFLLQWL